MYIAKIRIAVFRTAYSISHSLLSIRQLAKPLLVRSNNPAIKDTLPKRLKDELSSHSSFTSPCLV